MTFNRYLLIFASCGIGFFLGSALGTLLGGSPIDSGFAAPYFTGVLNTFLLLFITEDEGL